MPSLPFLPLPIGVGVKRPRLDGFDPFEPEDALRTFGKVRSNLSAVEASSALALLRDYVIDLATDRVAVYDVETTELIDRCVRVRGLVCRGSSKLASKLKV